MTPGEEYAERHARHQAETDALTRQDDRLSNLRLWVVLAGGLMAWAAFGWRWFSPWLLLLPVIAFVGVMIRHERVVADRDRAKRRLAFYTLGRGRLAGTWMGTGLSGERFAEPSHPYADDLDVFGRGSLFELLCTARTAGGEEILATWLKAPSDAETIRARQQAVAELRPKLDLREDLALLGEDVRARAEPAALAAWGAQPPLLPERHLPASAVGLVVLTVGTLIAAAFGAGYVPFLMVLALGRLFEARVGARVRRVVLTIDRPARDLGLLAATLARLEREMCEVPKLRDLQAALRADGVSPARRIERLQSLTGLLALRGNPLLALPLTILLWTPLCAFAIERWRTENGGHVGRWIAVVGEFEALNALAGYAYEHPGDPFPEILDGEPAFQANGLGHPLLTGSLPNDVSLGGPSCLYVVSGSNMSGKSTLMRSVGVNTVLALAGAPVRAHSLRLTPLHLGASIRTNDSLQGGISRFYAEIMRLRQIVEIGRQTPPLLFLLDEILHGTNSHDRRIGAEAVVKTLLSDGGIGLVTTHDLALAALADGPELAAVNVHFEDQMEDGQMRFDYKLRPGVVEKSNAIALMRAVGLEV